MITLKGFSKNYVLDEFIPLILDEDLIYIKKHHSDRVYTYDVVTGLVSEVGTIKGFVLTLDGGREIELPTEEHIPNIVSVICIMLVNGKAADVKTIMAEADKFDKKSNYKVRHLSSTNTIQITKLIGHIPEYTVEEGDIPMKQYNSNVFEAVTLEVALKYLIKHQPKNYVR